MGLGAAPDEGEVDRPKQMADCPLLLGQAHILQPVIILKRGGLDRKDTHPGRGHAAGAPIEAEIRAITRSRP